MTNSLNLCRILVPVDFSDFSRKAFPVAEALAKIFSGKITPFHSYELYSDLEGFHYLGEDFRLDGSANQIEAELKQRLKSFAASAVDNTYLGEEAVAPAVPYQAIVDRAEDHDLVVMGSHGRSGFSRLFMGSVAEKVLRLANKPVVIVEDESGFAPIDKILVTTDFSENSRAVLPYAKEIADATGAEIHLIHAVCDDTLERERIESIKQERTAKLRELADRHLGDRADNAKLWVELGGDSVHTALRDHIEKHEYNLVLMATVGRTGLNYLRLGSTTASLVREIKTVVMTVKPS